MKILRYALLGLTCLLFTAASRPPTTPKDNLVATVNRLQDEVAKLTLEEEILIHKAKKEQVETNKLIDDMDKAIRKIDSHEITYWNDEIADIDRRIGDLHDKSNKITHKGDDLRHREVAVKCELDVKPRLKRLVSVDRLLERIGELNSLMDEYNPQIAIYNDSVDDFYSKANRLPKR